MVLIKPYHSLHDFSIDQAQRQHCVPRPRPRRLHLPQYCFCELPFTRWVPRQPVERRLVSVFCSMSCRFTGKSQSDDKRGQTLDNMSEGLSSRSVILLWPFVRLLVCKRCMIGIVFALHLTWKLLHSTFSVSFSKAALQNCSVGSLLVWHLQASSCHFWDTLLFSLAMSLAFLSSLLEFSYLSLYFFFMSSFSCQ